jgi:uncharacterized protein YgiM (DUF1202 family)
MKKLSYISLSVIMAAVIFTAPLFAFTPFDESTVVNVENKQDDLETADVSVKSENTSSDYKSSVKGTITAEALNIRSYPWGDIIGTYNKGDQIDIIGELGDWYKVNYNGRVGYIHGNWVTTPNKQGQTAPKYGVVNNCLWANVHRTPSGDVLTKFQSGEKVYILGEVGDWYKIKYNGNEAFISKNYVDTTNSSDNSNGSNNNNSNSNESLESFTGYVTATALNVRTGAWGTIVGNLYKGDEVKVIGKSGDWYQIEYNGTTRYVSTKYIYNPKDSGSSSGSNISSDSSNAVAAGDGSLQQNIVSSARSLVGSTNFRTSDVSGGRLACAKVATTALKNAGALDRVYLNCRDSVKALKAKGWVEVTPPPYQEGDVITWKTYDYTGDGIKDEDTHIGIILKEGNTYKAMNNSSSLRTPRISDINIAPISRVLRKA